MDHEQLLHPSDSCLALGAPCRTFLRVKPISLQPDAAPGKAARFLAPALILGTIFLAYLNAFPGAFQFDDFNVIVDNGRVHGLAAWAGDLRGIRPLLKLTYTLNWMAGPGPWGFHLVNLAIHGANGLLAFTLLKRFAPGEAGAGTIALAATLVFALHPAQTEAVTYICGRSTSLMALFYLASLLAFIQGKAQGSRAWNLLSVLLFLLACLSKETALTLPFALLLWERAAGPWRGLKPALRATSLHWLLFGALCLGIALHPAQRMLLAAGFSTRSIPMNLLNQVQAQVYLLGTWFWPAQLNIDPFLPERARLTWASAGLAALLMGLAGAGLFALRSRPWLGFGLLWFFLHLAPTNSFIPRFDLVNERQLYLPSLGLAFILVHAARDGIRRFKVDARLAMSCLLLLTLSLGIRTAVRNRDYRSEVTLWRSSLRASPQNPRAHNNLGYAYLLQGDREQARKSFEAALALNPDYPLARANLDSLTR